MSKRVNLKNDVKKFKVDTFKLIFKHFFSIYIPFFLSLYSLKQIRKRKEKKRNNDFKYN